MLHNAQGFNMAVQDADMQLPASPRELDTLLQQRIVGRLKVSYSIKDVQQSFLAWHIIVASKKRLLSGMQRNFWSCYAYVQLAVRNTSEEMGCQGIDLETCSLIQHYVSPVCRFVCCFLRQPLH